MRRLIKYIVYAVGLFAVFSLMTTTSVHANSAGPGGGATAPVVWHDGTVPTVNYTGEVWHMELVFNGTNYVEGGMIQREYYSYTNHHVGYPAAIVAKNDGVFDGTAFDGYRYMGWSATGSAGPFEISDSRVITGATYVDQAIHPVPVHKFYYAKPILCNASSASIGHELGSNFACYETVDDIAVNRPSLLGSLKQDRAARYVNGYLTKESVEKPYEVKDSEMSKYVFNYAPIIQPSGVFGVTQVNIEGYIREHPAINTSSTNDPSKIYIADGIFDNPYMVPNLRTGTSSVGEMQVDLGGYMTGLNVGRLSDLVKDVTGPDMKNWTDEGLPLTLEVPNNDFKPASETQKAKEITSEFRQTFRSINMIAHNYQADIEYGGVPFFARYIGSNLEMGNSTIHTNTTGAPAQLQNYQSVIANSYTPEWTLTVGFESAPTLLDQRTGFGGTLWYDTNRLKLYTEKISTDKQGWGRGAGISTEVDVNPLDINTQRAIDLTTDLVYTNELSNVDMPYVSDTMRSNLHNHSNILTFAQDKAYYFVSWMDYDNAGFSDNVLDRHQDVLIAVELDPFLKVTGTSINIPTFRNFIPMSFMNYRGDTTTNAQAVTMITKDAVAVGENSGLVYMDEDGRQPVNPTDWRAGTYKEIFENPGSPSIVKTLIPGLQNNYRDFMQNSLGIMLIDEDHDRLVSSGTASLYLPPLHIPPNSMYTLRLNMQDVGLNDFTFQSDHVFGYKHYLIGQGLDSVYSAQKSTIEAGEKAYGNSPVTIVQPTHTLLRERQEEARSANPTGTGTGSPTSSNQNVWRRLNETRMMYLLPMTEIIHTTGNVSGGQGSIGRLEEALTPVP